jgi:hypothetical protein
MTREGKEGEVVVGAKSKDGKRWERKEREQDE